MAVASVFLLAILNNSTTPIAPMSRRSLSGCGWRCWAAAATSRPALGPEEAERPRRLLRASMRWDDAGRSRPAQREARWASYPAPGADEAQVRIGASSPTTCALKSGRSIRMR